MAYVQVPTRTTADANSAADVNQLELNIEALKGGTASVAPTTTIEALASRVTALEYQTITAKTDNHTLALVDAGRVLTMSAGTAKTFTVPTNASVAFTTGTRIDLVRIGSGAVDVAASGGVTVSSADSKLKLRVQYSGATLLKVDTNTWYLFGDISA